LYYWIPRKNKFCYKVFFFITIDRFELSSHYISWKLFWKMLVKCCSKFALPVTISPKWSISRQDELDWGGAGILRSDIPQNKIHAASLSIAFQYFMERPRAYLDFDIDFKLQEHRINSQDPAAPQSNSSCLEINHFGETATGSLNLEQHFYRNVSEKLPAFIMAWHFKYFNNNKKKLPTTKTNTVTTIVFLRIV